MALTDKLTAVADAIREKTGTAEKITLAQMPEMISAITGGGVEQYVNFYDYDGTLLRQYPLSEFAQLKAMPLPPNNLEGCTCTGWNYDLETIKAMNCHVNVAAIYQQNEVEADVFTASDPVYVDGTKLYLHMEQETAMTLYFRQSVTKGVTVLWGDDTSSESSISYGNNNLSLQHTYSPGDYVLSFALVEGCTLSLGISSTNTSVFGSNSINSTWTPRLLCLEKAEIDLRNTVLLSGAFRGCMGLKEVIFGDGKSSILNTYVFDLCYALEKVQLCDSITYIYDYAFRQCYRLREITIPLSVTALGSYAFTECRRLRMITIPGTVKTINSYAFQNCTNLKNAEIRSGVQTLGTGVFAGCQHLKEVTIASTVKTMNSQCFYQCYSLKNVILPNGVTSIASSLFQNCLSLRTVVIPEGVKSITASSAFSGCVSLGFIGFPKSLTSIGSSSFTGCYALKNAVIGAECKTIEAAAFQNCYTLEYVILPSSVTTLGINAFQNCTRLKNIILPETQKTTTGVFSGCDIQQQIMRSMYEEMLAGCTVLRDSAFESCRYLEKAILPSVLTAIGTSAFRYNYGLQAVEVPGQITNIGNYAFQNDYRLRNLRIPSAVTSLGSNCFEMCSCIEAVDIPSRVTTLGASCFASCYGLMEIILRTGNMVTGTSAFANTYSLEKLTIQPTMQALTLAQNALAYSGIEAIVNLPQNTILGETAIFSNCYALESADIENVAFSSINSPNSLFLNNYALADVKMPKRVSVLGSSMFQTCFALSGIVEIGENVDTINSNAFYDCRNLEGVRFLGNNLTTINSNAFYNCYSMKEVSIPYTVSKMQTCFPNCYGLSRIYVYPLTPPTGVTSIGTFADGYKIYVPKGYLAAYEAQWTSHKGHYEEFEFMIADRKTLKKTIALHDMGTELKNAFIHTTFDEGQTFTITTAYSGKNLAEIKAPAFDFENSLISFQFDRAEEVDYSAIETVDVHIQADGTDIACDFSVQLRYVDTEMVSEFSVENVASYGFLLNSMEYYESSNEGVQNSYSLCRVNFVSVTGKLYVDCIGEGEANFDFGILSNIDQVLSSNNSVDAGTMVKKSFYGDGKYNQTVEYDIDDLDEHFIYIKFRKDGSVNTGADNMQFQIRFDDV